MADLEFMTYLERAVVTRKVRRKLLAVHSLKGLAAEMGMPYRNLFNIRDGKVLAAQWRTLDALCKRFKIKIQP